MDSKYPWSLDEEVAALSRGSDRDSLFMQATIRIAGQPEGQVVRVRNLSAGGMLAEGPVAAAAGLAMEIDLPNLGFVPGRVVWVGQGKFGIAFGRQINPQAVRRQIVRTSTAPTYSAAPGPFYRRR